ncbi:MAG: (d)CMP kinase [Oscillospiraceae bacterium]|nr:(d)CMP kinase [Oscillospiraceae bacterium]
MKEHYSIAIDGPSGAGKSTMAQAVAAALGCVYLDTGAIYRTVACHMALMGISPRDGDGVRRLLDDVNIEIRFPGDGVQHMILNGRDMTGELRTPEISRKASLVSAQPTVRAYLLEVQRDIAKQHSVIMDGRDIGTVVLPDADVKIFLTASPEIRARRRFLELREKGHKKETYDHVLEEMKQRDLQDSTREIAPLRPADDAVIIDTSDCGVEESIRRILAVIREKLGQ